MPVVVLAFPQAGSRLAEFLASPVLGRAIAQDLHEAEVLAVFPAQRHHLTGGPEARAVLAQVPALVVRAAVFEGQAHLGARAADGAVLGGEDASQVAPTHLIGRPTQDALGPDVPVRDEPFPIRQDDGEAGDAVEDGRLPKAGVRVTRSSRVVG